MRPALQPWLAALGIQLHHGLGLTSPFTIAFSLRLLSAIAAIVVSFEVCVRLLRPVSSRLLRQAAVFFAFFLWIAPTAHGRFPSENWGGMWLAAGVCLAIDALAAWEGERRRSTLLAALAGAAWGLGFYFRFQVAIAIAGAGLWLLFVRRAPARLLVTIALGFAVACAANVVLDHLVVRRLDHQPPELRSRQSHRGQIGGVREGPVVAGSRGLLVALVPPFSLALIALLVVGSWHARRDLVPWIAVPFIAAHMLVAHKEPRFFMPLLYFIGPWLAICAASLPAGIGARLARWRRPLVAMAGAFCAVNAIALCVTVVVPVNDRILLDEWLWAQQVRGVRTVYAATPRKIGVPANVTNTFYESGVAMPQFERGDIERSTSQRPAFVYYAGTTAPAEVARLGCVPVFRTYPTWLADSKLFRRLSAIEADSICRIN